MDIFTTADGTKTYYNPEYTELYHSKTGAVEEAVKKYAEPCKVALLAKAGRLRILDIGFGLGYNAAAALDHAMASEPGCNIEIISLEKDPAVFSLISSLDPPFKSYRFIKRLSVAGGKELILSRASLRVVLGPAEETIKGLKGSFDIVFHDPFAPRNNPELWTFDFFTSVRSLLKPGAVLATYSCARHVRDNLQRAGFRVEDGPHVGRRGPSTLAYAI